jgi:hypothetical protein
MRSKLKGIIILATDENFLSIMKISYSSGFGLFAAYIVDFDNKVEFMLTGTIYVNKDGVLNDNKYEYEETGYPFFKEVGNIIYQHELQRERKHRPDLKSLSH